MISHAHIFFRIAKNLFAKYRVAHISNAGWFLVPRAFPILTSAIQHLYKLFFSLCNDFLIGKAHLGGWNIQLSNIVGQSNMNTFKNDEIITLLLTELCDYARFTAFAWLQPNQSNGQPRHFLSFGNFISYSWS